MVWDLATGRRRAPLHAHDFDPLGTFSHDGKRLLTAAADGVARTFSFTKGILTPLATQHVPGMFVEALAIHPDATKAAFAGSGALVVQDVLTGELTRAIPKPIGVTALAVDARAMQVAFGADTGALGCSTLPASGTSIAPKPTSNTTSHAVLRWDALTYTTVPATTTPPTPDDCAIGAAPNTLDFSPGGRLVASAPTGGAVASWNAATGEIQRYLTEATYEFPVSSIALSSRDPIVIAAAWGKLRAWRLSEGTSLPAFAPPGEANTITFSPDGRFLVGASRHGTVSVWRVTDHATRLKLALTLELADPDGALARSPDGLIQWLGPSHEHASCVLGSHLYPVELCANRFEDPKLIARVFSER